MKIGILTYSHAQNYGAAFQCRALNDFLKSRYPNLEFEVINYLNDAIYKKEDLLSIFKNKNNSASRKFKYFLSVPFLLKKRHRFKAFVNCKPPVYTKNNIFEINHIYDSFIIGSDQLWNFRLNGNDDTFFLPFINNKKRITTYSTSIGEDIISYSNPIVFFDSISQYSSISVREDEARIIISSKIGLEPSVVLDPVFLPGNDYWMAYCKKSRKKHVTFYLFQSKLIDKCKKIIALLNYGDRSINKVCGGISLNDFLNPKIKTSISYGPLQVLSSICNSEYVFTDSFHCMAMCIIFHVPFTVFLGEKHGSNSRIKNLLRIAGLESRIFIEDEPIRSDIDWESVDERISKERHKSIDFLDTAIRTVEAKKND